MLCTWAWNTSSYLNFQPAGFLYRFQCCQPPQLHEPVSENKSLSSPSLIIYIFFAGPFALTYLVLDLPTWPSQVLTYFSTHELASPFTSTSLTSTCVFLLDDHDLNFLFGLRTIYFLESNFLWTAANPESSSMDSQEGPGHIRLSSARYMQDCPPTHSLPGYWPFLLQWSKNSCSTYFCSETTLFTQCSCTFTKG